MACDRHLECNDPISRCFIVANMAKGFSYSHPDRRQGARQEFPNLLLTNAFDIDIGCAIGTNRERPGWQFNFIKKPLEFPLHFQEESQAVSQADFYYCIFTVYTYVFREWDSQAVVFKQIFKRKFMDLNCHPGSARSSPHARSGSRGPARGGRRGPCSPSARRLGSCSGCSIPTVVRFSQILHLQYQYRGGGVSPWVKCSVHFLF